MKKLENAPVLATELVAYRYDLSNPDEKAQYRELEDSMKEQGIPKFDVIAEPPSEKAREMESGTIYLDTSCLFENQWNTTEDSPVNPGCRVFNWYEKIYPNRNMKAGHYVVVPQQLHDMIERDVLQCGFCNSYFWAESAPGKWCNQCVTSKYLSEEHLHLLKLKPVGHDRRKSETLSDEEFGEIKQRYMEAWEKTHKPQILRSLDAEYEKVAEKARKKRDGMRWLVQNDIDIENCIYYDHTNTFCFGWRQRLSEDEKELLKAKLQGFPFQYELK